MASLLRFARHVPIPAMAALAAQEYRFTSCDAEKAKVKISGSSEAASTPLASSFTHVAVKPAVQKPVVQKPPSQPSDLPGNEPAVPTRERENEKEKKKEPVKHLQTGMRADEEGDYHGLFPLRQLWQPKIHYPLWDDNWDGRKPSSTGNLERDRERARHLRKTGVTRHIILIRHGQYDETHKEDSKRVLTELGRKQAELTGKRLAEMARGVDDEFGPCSVKVLRVSDLVRAKQTADIIASHLPNVEFSEPDPLLNEGRPAHHIPGGKATPSVIKKLDDQHPRIEEAFQKLFYRAPVPNGQHHENGGKDGIDDVTEMDDVSEEPHPKHEFEVIVCHANVIRYFLCRALQLPPETWLRWCTFNCSLTYLTIRPTGTVSCRMLGDIGHLPYDLSTFSGHHGYNW